MDAKPQDLEEGQINTSTHGSMSVLQLAVLAQCV